MKKYVYQYCAQHQISTGSITLTDGVAAVEEKILTHDQYLDFKKKIDSENHNRLSIISLSLICETNV